MLFIAEIGMNHNGNFDLVYELVRQAHYAGADIAKFQCGWRDGDGEINPINADVLKKMISWCAYFGIEPMVSIISEKAFEYVKQCPFARYKIASRTLIDNLPLAQRIVALGKETIVSLGMWNKPERPFTPSGNIRYLWCRSKYPSEPQDLVGLPKNFPAEGYAGYSDHSIGIDAALLAIARGAVIVEKHFTLDKSDRTIRDHVLSATPDEFRTMVLIGREIARKLAVGV